MYSNVPHLLKLIDNNILDYGIKIGNKLINSGLLFELINNQSGELSIVHKVNITNLTIKQSARQKVSTAAHLLSNVVFGKLQILL